MRVRLKGLNSISKRLADGTLRTYWDAWKGGPALRGEPGTPEFIASYNEACARKVVPPRGTLLTILQQYQSSEDFTGLADSTRRSYVALIARIEKQFADFPLAALTDRRTRSIFIDWRDRIARELRTPTSRLRLDGISARSVMGTRSRYYCCQSMRARRQALSRIPRREDMDGR